MSDHREWDCATPGCGNVICLTPAMERRLRESHDTFVCPLGHKQSFRGKSDDEKRIDELERDVRWWRATYNEMRCTARTCPWPTCRTYVYSSREVLYAHMRREHGMPLVRDVADAPAKLRVVS